MRERYDLIAIGGGLAGLSAAVRGAELGLATAVVEKGMEPDYPCNTRVSGGVFHIAYADVKLPKDALRKLAEAAVGGVADPALLAALLEDGPRAIDWLRAKGAGFVRGPNRAWVMAPPRPPATRLDVWHGRGPDMVLRCLTKALAEAGGDLLLGARAHDLAMEGGRCAGVNVEHGGRTVTLRADAVVIADGGFQSNPDMVAAHIGPSPQRILQRNARVSTGDGLAMALRAGAATTRLDRFYGHVLSADAFTNDDLWPFPQIDLVGASAIIVGRDGQRLFDEGLGGIHAANMLARLDDPLSATVVCDEAVWDSAGKQAVIPPNPVLEQKGGTIHRAATLDQLASKAGIAGPALEETVRTYNAAILDGVGAKLRPPRSGKKGKPQPLVGPFLAIPVCSGMTNTMGGLKVDADARVLALADGKPIPGLYAAGAATGGLEGGPEAAYVGGLSRAGVFGMRAAEHAHSLVGA